MKENGKLDIGFRSDTGKVRTNNEDSCVVDKELGLFIVADGMGGHQSGEVASKMAAQTIQENFKNMVKKGIKPEKYISGLSLKANQLGFCAHLANQAIYEAAQYPQNKGMGTTLSAALIHEGTLAYAHVGDSRIYLMRQGTLKQITLDHSLVMDQVRKGLISKEEAEKSKLSNVLLRAVGTEKSVQVDVEEHSLSDGDLILLCSDGLNKMVTDNEIETILRSIQDPQEICDTLVEAANGAGGRDNTTVVAVRNHSTASLLSDLKSKFNSLGRKQTHG